MDDLKNFFNRKFLEEEMVIQPRHLTPNLFENLRLLLTSKYLKFYKNVGYIFNIQIEDIPDNKITLSGQICLVVKFTADLYIPKVDHIFRLFVTDIKTSVACKNYWVEIESFIIYLRPEDISVVKDAVEIDVKITSVKSDKTLCFGSLTAVLQD